MQLAFIGCGVIAESMVARILSRGLIAADQIIASHPRSLRREELIEKYRIHVVESNAEAVARSESSLVVLSVKPQRLSVVLEELEDSVSSNQLILSTVAGAKIETLSRTLGTKRVVRAMPNTPAQIGRGITAWTCTDEVSEAERSQVKELLKALGRELFMETENMIDMATSLSATGPTYTFLVMEALTDAGVHMGFSRETAKELVQETIRMGKAGSGLRFCDSH
jgi:pyrroline-5-carboxylate reductase